MSADLLPREVSTRPSSRTGAGLPAPRGRRPLAHLRGLALAGCWALVVLSCSGLTAQILFSEPSAVKYVVTVVASFLVALAVAMNQPLFCVACLLTVVAPVAPFAATFFGVTFKPVYVLLGLAGLFLTLGTGRRLGPSLTARVVPVAALLLVVPFAISSHPWQPLWIFLTGGMTAWVVARVVVTDGPWRLAAVLVGTATFQGAIAILQYQTGNAFDIYSGSSAGRGDYFFNYDGMNRSTGFFYDPISLANVLAASVPVAVVLLLHLISRRRYWRALVAGVCAVVIVAGLITTLSRMSWVGALAGMAVCVILLPRRYKFWTAGTLVVGAVVGLRYAAVLAGPALALRIGSILHPTGIGVMTAQGDEARQQLWAYSIGTFTSHPVTGIGLGDLPYAMQRDVLGASLTTHAHSVYFHLAAEGGVLALTALALVTLAWVRDVVSTIRVENLLVAGVLGALVSFAVGGLTDTPLIKQQSVMTFAAVILGLGLGVAARARGPLGTTTPEGERALVLP